MAPRFGILHGLAVGVAFAGAVVAGCWGINAAAPFPRIAQVADKLNAIEHSAEPHDVLFFGSSKIYSGIIPTLFDEVLAGHGHRFHSYNMGVDGMGYPESGYLCDRALARRKGAARWVFLEVSSVRTHVPPLQKGTRRFVYWHDLPRTLLLSEVILERRQNPQGRAEVSPEETLRLHLQAWLQRSTNAGEGAELVRGEFLPPAKPKARDKLDPALRGYCAISNIMAGTELQNFRRGLDEFGTKHKRAEPMTEEAMREFAAQVAGDGAQTILINAPNPAPNPRLFANSAPGSGDPPVFGFADPERYPLLYREEHRGDAAHLNHAGAEAFTVYLAERFAEHLRASPAAAPSAPSRNTWRGKLRRWLRI